jgi:hypothetical protein
MTLEEAIKHYGTQVNLATALGVRTAAISNWRKRGGAIPSLQQVRLEARSGGALKADKGIV